MAILEESEKRSSLHGVSLLCSAKGIKSRVDFRKQIVIFPTPTCELGELNLVLIFCNKAHVHNTALDNGPKASIQS